MVETDRSKLVLPGNPWEAEDAATKSAPASDAVQQKLLDDQVIPRSYPPWRPKESQDSERPQAPGSSEIVRPPFALDDGENKVRLAPNIDLVIPNLPDFWIIDKEKPNSDQPAGSGARSEAGKPTPEAQNPNEKTKPNADLPGAGQPKVNDDSKAPTAAPYNPFNDPSFRPLRPGESAWWNKTPPESLPKEIFKPTDNTNGGGPRVTAEKVVEFHNMRYRSADHGNLPDALIRLPRNFDPSKPINLVVYNHGYRDSIRTALVNAELGRQLDLAPPNTVLVLPEWQKYAGASNAVDGDFGNQNQFKNMLQEIFDKTPELKGKTLNDVKNIDVISHSGGDKALVSIVNNNGLGGKITSLTLLDSTYVIGNQLDMWMRLNIHDLASGRKQLRSIYNDTASASRAQAGRLRQMLINAGYSSNKVFSDDRGGQPAMTADELARNPIVYKYTDVTYKGKGPHTSLPMLYIGPIQAANRDTRK